MPDKMPSGNFMQQWVCIGRQVGFYAEASRQNNMLGQTLRVRPSGAAYLAPH